jgi:hypothetical protein
MKGNDHVGDLAVFRSITLHKLDLKETECEGVGWIQVFLRVSTDCFDNANVSSDYITGE